MTNAGLINVSPAEVSSAVASAVPGVLVSSDDPISGLQQAVADQHGFAMPTSDAGVVSSFIAQDAGPVIGNAGLVATTQDSSPPMQA